MQAGDASMTDDPQGRAKGGYARAESLSAEKRAEIAKKAAKARWSEHEGGLAQETHSGTLRIADRELPVSVLGDGTRVFSISGLIRAVGSRRKGGGRSDDGSFQLPPFLATAAVKPYIPQDLVAPLLNPIPFRAKRGGNAIGYEATLLPSICEVILDAAKAGKLRSSASQMVDTAELLLRGFARVGIIALIDEATGYQSERDRDALQQILDLYIGQELAKWAKRFPDEFYAQMFRLKGWQFNPNNSQRPHAMARLTIDLVFDRIGPGLSADLKKRRQELLQASGRKKAKLHQVMTPDIGHPALQHHLSGLIFLAKSFSDRDWNGFYGAVERVAPRYNRTLPLPLDGSDATGEQQAITGDAAMLAR
jgi:hypothetical protein